MKLFHCDHCGHILYFENYCCLTCGHTLAFLPDVGSISSLDRQGNGIWTSPEPAARGKRYRLCKNYLEQNTCNWAIPDDDDHSLCVACRTTRIIPDLSIPGQRELWARIESAKRRLLYTLLQLNLPLETADETGTHSLTFNILAHTGEAGLRPTTTGYEEGVITLDLNEADDAERARRRVEFHESYRTLLGHFRHEIGHYYWEQLIRDPETLDEFRRLFGDERENRETAIETYYAEGPKAGWRDHFISAFASSHPLEDWAETWAHYLHMVDTLETGAACGVEIVPLPELSESEASDPFSAQLQTWQALVHGLNNLNRSLGLGDAYPFSLPKPVVEKLRFVDRIIHRHQAFAVAA